MTIQWTIVAGFLYLEVGFICLLILPFISSKVWQYAFYSRFFRTIADKANVFFTVFIIVLIFFFLDSVREMINYSKQSSIDLGQELQIHLKLFRSQRNYYISGFTVFLWLVIRRLIMLVLTEAELLDENETAMKRAQNATETVEKILRNKENMENEATDLLIPLEEAKNLRKAIEIAKNDLSSTEEAVEEVTERSLRVSKEYEDLLERHNTLLNKSACSEEDCDTEST